MVVSNDLIRLTPSISVSLNNCGIVNSNFPFILDQPVSCVFNLFLDNCYFERSVKAITIKKKGHRLKVINCMFSYNKECFSLEDSKKIVNLEEVGQIQNFYTNEKETTLKEITLNSALVSHCIFSYNEKIINANQYNFEIKFTRNNVKYTIHKGFMFHQCKNVVLSENCFEINFDPKLFEEKKPSKISEIPSETKSKKDFQDFYT